MRFGIKLSSGLLLALGLITYNAADSFAQRAGVTGGGSQTPGVAQPPGSAPNAPASQIPNALPQTPSAPALQPGNPAGVPNSNQQSLSPGPGATTSPAFNPQPFIMHPIVGQNLGLTSQQQQQLTTTQQQLMNNFNTRMQGLNNLPQAEQNARMQTLRNQFNTQFGTAANGILTQQQQQRLQQLQLQQPGFSAFGQPAMQSQLNLTPNQVSQLATKQADFNRQLQQIRMTQDPGRRAQLWEQLRDSRMDALRSVLTPQQLQTWSQLTGRPFGFTMDMDVNGSR
jgi:hypothetical protein